MAYTRKKYIRGSPLPKITKFTMGDTSGSFDYNVFLVTTEKAQIRHMALESARVATNRFLEEKLINKYFLRILCYPHVILRENKMIFGAHADRLQDGMRAAFGKAVGLAARVKNNQKIITVNVNENGIEVAKEALKRGKAKLPIPCRIFVENSSQGRIPS